MKQCIRLFGLFALSLIANQAKAIDFMPLGDFSGGTFWSSARNITPDGMIVVGQGVTNTGSVPFTWSNTTGLRQIELAAGHEWGQGLAVSNDGTKIIGDGFNGNNQEAFIWNENTGSVGISAPEGHTSSFANDISGNGLVVVGHSSLEADLPGEHESIAFKWTENDGLQSLGDLPGGRTESVALGVTPDGDKIVGYAIGNDNLRQVFLWEESTGMVGLGSLYDGQYSSASDISSDGSTIIGTGVRPGGGINGVEAFIWNELDGFIGLGDLEGGSVFSSARATNADGSVVVGIGKTEVGQEAFVWNENDGMSSVQELLINGGINLDGWQLSSALGISDNGKYVVGHGINPDGNTEAWIANISTVPVPAAVWLFGSGLLGLTGVARRKAHA